ncbi:MAG: type II toxin-antitoxin system RelE/ParE family toxin [Planctomycetaceae bacterium]|nr:type II toxin-antitoxin system RelE/ParE family toxin [Planctomycetaceae bacterium]
MNYQVQILRRAQRDLARLPKQEYEQVRDAIQALGDDPRPSGCKKLTGREGWRIRIGPFRVIYEIEDVIRVVTVLDIGHRRDIYR